MKFMKFTMSISISSGNSVRIENVGEIATSVAFLSLCKGSPFLVYRCVRENITTRSRTEIIPKNEAHNVRSCGLTPFVSWKDRKFTKFPCTMLEFVFRTWKKTPQEQNLLLTVGSNKKGYKLKMSLFAI